MIGSILGDIAGSVYEFHNIKTKEFPFLTPQKGYTDDSILTFATADWLLHDGDCATYYFRYATRYPCPLGGFGGRFREWLRQGQQTGQLLPYGSCGNGSAMRVGPVGWAFRTEEETLEAARISAACTHNHPEGIKGAQATALCIFLARNGKSKEDIKNTVEAKFGYDLNFTCDGIRETYQWDATCQGTVPQSIRAFLDGTDFEDCVRTAISLGGDSDTLACITGSIAEAFYGIPPTLHAQAMHYLPTHFQQIVAEFKEKYGPEIR